MKNRSVLIVEDDALIAEDIKELCEMQGCHCILAYNAGQALIALKESTLDLVLLDINISDDIDGIEIAQKLEGEYKLPYLFITSHSDFSTLERVKGLRYLSYIVKPFNKQQFLATLELSWAKMQDVDPKLNQEKIKAANLSSREIEILNMLLDGMTLRAVGEKLFLSENTVKYHQKNIYLKFDVHRRSELFALLK